MAHQMKAAEMEIVKAEVRKNVFEYWSGRRLLLWECILTLITSHPLRLQVKVVFEVNMLQGEKCDIMGTMNGDADLMTENPR